MLRMSTQGAEAIHLLKCIQSRIGALQFGNLQMALFAAGLQGGIGGQPVLRHWGCAHGQFLGCDSGGWYHLDHIARILHRYVTESDSISEEWRPNWVRDLRSKLAGRRLLEGMTVDAWLIVLLHSLSPESHQPPRYQLVLKKVWKQDSNVFVRPYAVRAASGHSGIDILDPERIAAVIPQGISS